MSNAPLFYSLVRGDAPATFLATCRRLCGDFLAASRQHCLHDPAPHQYEPRGLDPRKPCMCALCASFQHPRTQYRRSVTVTPSPRCRLLRLRWLRLWWKLSHRLIRRYHSRPGLYASQVDTESVTTQAARLSSANTAAAPYDVFETLSTLRPGTISPPLSHATRLNRDDVKAFAARVGGGGKPNPEKPRASET